MGRSQAPDDPGPLSGAHVLVVEDELLLAMELKLVLTGAGACCVETCGTLAKALAWAERDAITAAVLDVRLGRESVAPVARALARRGTPFCFYTGQVGSEGIVAEWPRCRVVSKPAQPQQIVAAVAELLQA